MLSRYKIDLPDASLANQMRVYLEAFDQVSTVQHHLEVANAAEQLAKRFGGDCQKATIAGLFHDISMVIPNDERLAFQEYYGLEIVPEERKVPLLLHQNNRLLWQKSSLGSLTLRFCLPLPATRHLRKIFQSWISLFS